MSAFLITHSPTCTTQAPCAPAAQQQQRQAEEEEEDAGELTGSLPTGVDLSFMNGHDSRSDAMTAAAVRQQPLSRTSVTSSVESLASISSAPTNANGLPQQHGHFAGATHLNSHGQLGNGPADFSAAFAPDPSVPGPGALPRRHSLSHEHTRAAVASAFPQSLSQPLRSTASGSMHLAPGREGSGFPGLAGVLMNHQRGTPSGGGYHHQHLGGISQALGLAQASTPFPAGDAAVAQQQRAQLAGGAVVGGPPRHQANGLPHSAHQRFHQRGGSGDLAALQQKAAAMRGGTPAVMPAQQQHVGRVGTRVSPPMMPPSDRTRSPAVGPYFAANGHSAAFAPTDPALPGGAFHSSLLNGFPSRPSAPGRDGPAPHQLW